MFAACLEEERREGAGVGAQAVDSSKRSSRVLQLARATWLFQRRADMVVVASGGGRGYAAPVRRVLPFRFRLPAPDTSFSSSP